MSSDASVETLIDELKTDYHRSQFESLFKRKTKHLSGPEKLQARMRINELAKPALGVVDLRKKIPAEVKPYSFQGRTHYFDLAARRLFEEGLRLYKGVFTNDTKQKILALKEHHQQLAESMALAQEKQDKALDSFVAGRSYVRNEERMNMVTSVKMKLADNQQFKAMTVDVSIDGLQLKLSPEPQLSGLKHGRIKVCFSGLADDFVFDGDQEYEYRVVGVKENDVCVYLRLKRLNESSDDALSQFLSSMLAKFRRRYKVNVDHIAQRVIARGHERCWLEAIQALPILLSDKSSSCVVVKTNGNQALLNSWQQHQNDLIAELIEQPWVQSVIHELRNLREVTRKQVLFFRISLPVNKIWREYLLPFQALKKETSLLATLNELRAAGYGVRWYQLTLTYCREKQWTYAELNAIRTPLWCERSAGKTQLPVLQDYRTKGANELACKVLSNEGSVTQEIFRQVLSNAVFLYRDTVDWEPKLAGLMPVADGISKVLSETDFWLANGDRIMGGSRLSSELRKALRRLPPNEKLSCRILLLRVTKTSQREGVIGRYLHDYESFEEAAEYIRFLNEDHNFLAILVSGQPCKGELSEELMADLSYIQRYLPHRARELENSFRQLQAVITLTDVTQALTELAELTAKS
ncbi:PilZ domain-containing protein [Idiomarina sp. HP20-50]|uniref:PilZ domain-containing protein n=1 Tax=Idiomarina sp. HP20-50 TaxID=3070813 RepID=UPI00294AAB06|nr:PilZ domain-containing protein [Idiomarina sp. HP20-50]MDV6316902.1 PilZ domain-containing protein [Idiomarina sp. HP20-50]